LGGEGIHYARRCVGIDQKLHFRIDRVERREAKTIKPEERRLSIELQIVLALQDVVEDAESPTYTGLLGRGESEAETGRPIIFIGEVGPVGRARIAGKEESFRSIDEPLGLLVKSQREGAALQIA